ncbi:MAG: peptidoglycan D,D-transpeptidase FtsI family protein, partial [Verrucomicrobiales bacterium]
EEASEASILTQKNARTMTLTVPAPRGMILDRNGEPLAQNKVGYHLALDFTKISTETSESRILSWARERIAEANRLSGGEWEVDEAKLLAYFHDRRWIPKEVSVVFGEEKAKEVQKQLPDGLVLLPVYLRHYPERSLGAHMIGYVGTRTRLPDGPINQGDPLFETSEGKAGFEKLFDEDLRGEPGRKRYLFDDQGGKLLEEWIRRPRAGGSVVTTLDLTWQRRAEKVLREGCERGALVVIDINTGEVLAMASRPSFDLNDFIPGISHEAYQELLNDPGNPLFARAFQGEYPPASTFKPVVALAALNNGVVKENTRINCPYQIKIGNHWFRNHTKTVEGAIDVKRALARSTNPWFYQVGIKTGPESFLSVARRLGFGSDTGLPLVGERPGLVPNNDYMEKTHGRRMMDGDTANLSIGQGVMLATPLQVAQAMAGIANGGVLPQLRLIKQIQDTRGRVVDAPGPEKKNDLNVSAEAIEAVQQGMEDVVHKGYGTGKNADLGYTVLAGKTGTAQWGPESKNQGLAWFSGFLPRENPRYAFAVLYEGKPNQSVAGGRLAAPMVRSFFKGLRQEIEDKIAPPAKALIVVEEEEEMAEPETEERPPMETEAEPAPATAEEMAEELPAPEDLDELDIPRAIIVEEDE